MIWLLLFIIPSVLSVCIPGKYKDVDSCVDCPVGYYKGEPDNPESGDWLSDRCTQCQTGFFQDELGQVACKSCVAGRYQDSAGQTNCKLCGINTVQPLENKTSCVDCSEMKYQNEEGQTECKGVIRPTDENNGHLYLYCPSRCPHTPCRTDEVCVSGTCVAHTCTDNAQASGCTCFGTTCNKWCMDNGECVDIVGVSDSNDIDAVISAYNDIQ